jgi:hypothetical protein
VGDRQPLRDSLDRMLAHLKANQVDVDQPVLTVGTVLELEPIKEQFIGNTAANQLLRRDDRAAFAVPQIA